MTFYYNIVTFKVIHLFTDFLFLISDDVTNGLIVYTMSDDVTDTRDNFEFSVSDSKPNTVDNVMFNIAWSYVSLSTNNITAEEMAGTIEVPVRRTGSLQEVGTIFLFF